MKVLSYIKKAIRGIQSYHMGPEHGWADIGYHWVITHDGVLRPGRSIYLMGAHTRGFNRESLGACVTGDNTVKGRHWNAKQIATARTLDKACKMVFPDLESLGHRDLAATLCPGLDIKELLK